MEVLSTVLIVVGTVFLFAGYFWALALAFRESAVRGIACVLVPLLLFYYLTTELPRTWKPLGVLTIGLATTIGGAVLSKG